jgi:ATP-binding cassette, subfamily B, bacterial
MIFVFDRGRIAERGRHDELIETGGVYAGIYRGWLGSIRAST